MVFRMRGHGWFVAGLLAMLVVALADLTIAAEAVLVSVLLVGPLLAAAGATAEETAVLGVIAVLLAIPLGISDGIWGTGDLLVRVLVTVLGSIAAVVSAGLRERRDAELRITRPQAADAQRLRIALAAGNMGTWRWDTALGIVEWDSHLEALFGLAPGAFDGTFETYTALVHPDDRDAVVAAVQEGMTRNEGWKFDHRCVWPDGTVHWLEGRGEPVHDATGAVVGATGVTVDIDERRRALEAERRVVEVLQQAVLPEALPVLPGVQLGAAYRPADAVLDLGGDWYDAFTTPDGAMLLVVGDVAGHGILAASVMGRVRNALRAYAVEDPDPATILMRLHRLLVTHDDSPMVTAFVGRHDPGTESLLWSRAGHLPPLLVPPDGKARFLEDVNGAPLGTISSPYMTAEAPLSAGTLLVCYTDGLVERRDAPLDDGLDWLAARVEELGAIDPSTLCDKLVDEPFVPRPSIDDMCVLALRT